MSASRILQELQDDVLRSFGKLQANLRTPVVDSNAVSVMADSSIKGWMNP
jgi:hypothetical protein